MTKVRKILNILFSGLHFCPEIKINTKKSEFLSFLTFVDIQDKEIKDLSLFINRFVY